MGAIILVLAPSFGLLAILLIAPLGIVLFRSVQEKSLLLRANREFALRHKSGVLIYSSSPNWQGYIEENWLPRLGESLIVLNYSERRAWLRKSIAVRMFDTFVGGGYQYNPAVILLRGTHAPLVFRFYQAFKNAKHGKTAALRELETEMFQHLSRAG